MRKQLNFDKLINFTSLTIAVVSLIISIVALKIAQQTLELSSKDFVPQFKYSFHENGDIEIINPNSDLFAVEFVDIIEIKTIGVEERIRKGYIEIPFVTRSLLFRKFNHEKFGENIIIKQNATGPCSYICEYDKTLISELKSKFEKEYNLESDKGFMPPSLQGKSTFVEVYYMNKNKIRNSVIFERTFLNGYGYDELIIPNEEFDQIVKKANIPKFDNVNELWDFVCENYFTPFNSK